MYGIHCLMIVCVLVVICSRLNRINKYLVKAGYTQNKGRLHL